jgi:chromosome segregation ATPase
VSRLKKVLQDEYFHGDSMKKNLEALSSELVNQRSLVQAKESELCTSQASLNNHSQKITSYQDQIESLKEELDYKDSQYFSLEEQSTKSISHHKTNAKNLEVVLQEKSSELEAFKAEILGSAGQDEALVAENQKLKLELEDFQRELAEYEKHRERHKKVQEDLVRDNEDLLARLEIENQDFQERALGFDLQ